MRLGRWSVAGGALFSYERIYWNGCRWTPFVWVSWRYRRFGRCVGHMNQDDRAICFEGKPGGVSEVMPFTREEFIYACRVADWKFFKPSMMNLRRYEHLQHFRRRYADLPVDLRPILLANLRAAGQTFYQEACFSTFNRKQKV